MNHSLICGVGVVLAGLALVRPAHADSAAATCQVHRDGKTNPDSSGPCTFSQRQGHIDLDLKNGTTFSLSPTGTAGRFKDQKGRAVVRTAAGGNEQEFRWDGGRHVVVTFAGASDDAPAAKQDDAGERRDEFGTVCGVIVEGKTYRYRCRAADVYSGSKKVRTVVHYPDQTIELTWHGGGRVGLQFEGMVPKEAKYATAEGETNFAFEGKTYFYYSDKGMAEMELQHFSE